jgi:hypothetical protein
MKMAADLGVGMDYPSRKYEKHGNEVVSANRVYHRMVALSIPETFDADEITASQKQ